MGRAARRKAGGWGVSEGQAAPTGAGAPPPPKSEEEKKGQPAARQAGGVGETKR